MTTQAISAKIFEELNELPLEQQHQVLAFARSLKAQPKGVKGASLLTFSDSIPRSDLIQMQQAIEKGCERIDCDDW